MDSDMYFTRSGMNIMIGNGEKIHRLQYTHYPRFTLCGKNGKLDWWEVNKEVDCKRCLEIIYKENKS